METTNTKFYKKEGGEENWIILFGIVNKRQWL